MKKKISDKNGVISFTLGIVSLITPFLGVFIAVMAIYFYTRQKKIRKTKLAMAGLILASISIAIYFIFPMLAMIGTYAKMAMDKLL